MKNALALVTSLLLSVSTSQAVDEATKASPEFEKMMAEGQSTYMLHCFACHQADGMGLMSGVRLAPPLSGSDWLDDDDRIIRIVLHGLVGEITVGDVTMSGAMIPYGNLIPMDDRKVALILSYIRNNFGNSGPLVSPKRVAEVREATKARTIPYTVEQILKAHPLKAE